MRRAADKKIPAPGIDGIWRGYTIIAVMALALGGQDAYQEGQLPRSFGGLFRESPAPVPLGAVRPLPVSKAPVTAGHAPSKAPLAKAPPETAPPVSPETRPDKKLNPRFQDPSDSMRPFFATLLQAEEGQLERPVRAAFFGNSEIGFDRVTSEIRRRFQSRFGDGGKGLLAATPGWRYQRHQDVHWKRSRNWTTHTLLERRRPDGRYGLAGIMSTNQGPAWLEFGTLGRPAEAGYFKAPTGSSISRFDLLYQRFPGGGDLKVEVDGRPIATVQGSAYSVQDSRYQIPLKDGPHRIRIRTDRFPARLYGAILERDRGFVLDAIMHVGAYADSMLNFSTDHLEEQVALRNPDLIIFQWGAKELKEHPDPSKWRIHAYERGFVKSVLRTRSGAPNASCLIVSTKDMGIRKRNLIESRPGVRKLVEASKRVAMRTGCAFFDLHAELGGAGSMERWFNQSPRLVSPDLGHVMRPGAILIGTRISEALLERYDRFQEEERL